jgi:hypothetical protein
MLTCCGAATCEGGERGDRGQLARGVVDVMIRESDAETARNPGFPSVGIAPHEGRGRGGRTAWTRVATRALGAVARGALTATPRVAVAEES